MAASPHFELFRIFRVCFIDISAPSRRHQEYFSMGTVSSDTFSSAFSHFFVAFFDTNTSRHLLHFRMSASFLRFFWFSSFTLSHFSLRLFRLLVFDDLADLLHFLRLSSSSSIADIFFISLHDFWLTFSRCRFFAISWSHFVVKRPHVFSFAAFGEFSLVAAFSISCQLSVHIALSCWAFLSDMFSLYIFHFLSLPALCF